MTFARPIKHDETGSAHLNVFECRLCAVSYSVKAVTDAGVNPEAA
jgi:hypothetical protein